MNLCVLGRVLCFRHEYEEAIAYLEEAIRVNPSFAQGYFALGFTLIVSGRARDALVHLDRAAELSPRDPHLASFHAIRAVGYLALDQLDTAERFRMPTTGPSRCWRRCSPSGGAATTRSGRLTCCWNGIPATVSQLLAPTSSSAATKRWCNVTSRGSAARGFPNTRVPHGERALRVSQRKNPPLNKPDIRTGFRHHFRLTAVTLANDAASAFRHTRIKRVGASIWCRCRRTDPQSGVSCRKVLPSGSRHSRSIRMNSR